MKIVVIDGVEYEEVEREESWRENTQYIAYRPLPPKPKTIVQVAAEKGSMTENQFRTIHTDTYLAAIDHIEQRLQALERKLEGK